MGGAARELFLDMNGRALAAEDPGETVGVPELWDGLDTLTAPTLVLVGDLDAEEEQVAAERLAAMIPGARFEKLAGTAHLPHVEGHARCLDALRDFIVVTYVRRPARRRPGG